MSKPDWHTETIRAAEAMFWRTPNITAEEMYRELGACATSTVADIALITWHLLYHSGKAPEGVRASRGQTYIVKDWIGWLCKARVTDPRDHRKGIMEIES